MSGELPYAALLRACYRIVDAASYLDWGLTSDYDAYLLLIHLLNLLTTQGSTS